MVEDTNQSLDSLDRRLVAAALERDDVDTRSVAAVSKLAAEFDLSETETKRRLARGMATVLRAHRSGEPAVKQRQPSPRGPDF